MPPRHYDGTETHFFEHFEAFSSSINRHSNVTWERRYERVNIKMVLITAKEPIFNPRPAKGRGNVNVAMRGNVQGGRIGPLYVS